MTGEENEDQAKPSHGLMQYIQGMHTFLQYHVHSFEGCIEFGKENYWKETTKAGSCIRQTTMVMSSIDSGHLTTSILVLSSLSDMGYIKKTASDSKHVDLVQGDQGKRQDATGIPLQMTIRVIFAEPSPQSFQFNMGVFLWSLKGLLISVFFARGCGWAWQPCRAWYRTKSSMRSWVSWISCDLKWLVVELAPWNG